MAVADEEERALPSLEWRPVVPDGAAAPPSDAPPAAPAPPAVPPPVPADQSAPITLGPLSTGPADVTPRVAADPFAPPTGPSSSAPAPAPTPMAPDPEPAPAPDLEPALAPDPAPVSRLASAAAVETPPVVAPKGRRRAAAESPLAVDVAGLVSSGRKDRSSGIARIGFIVLLVAAVVAAGIVVAKPYIFPGPWDPEAEAFAESIEGVRGVDFAEPLTIVEQTPGDHRALLTDQAVGSDADGLAMWRALGLAGPQNSDPAGWESTLGALSAATYSRTDGQVHVDGSYGLGDRSARTMQAMAEAALDQDYAFSARLVDLGLDERALVEAHVLQQIERIQRASNEPFTVTDPSIASFSVLPAPLDYRLSAPIVFADLLAPYNDVAANPLRRIGDEGPGPIVSRPLESIAMDSPVPSDTPVGELRVMDRSFWFMVLATHLESATAYEISNELDSAGLVVVEAVDGSCVVATLSTGGSPGDSALLGTLGAWAQAAASELRSSVTAIPGGAVQLRSCDPTGPYTSNARFGVARQLLGWRAAELALTTSILSNGGVPADASAAMPAFLASPGALATAELPAGTPANEIVASALAAVDRFDAGIRAQLEGPDPAEALRVDE